MADSPKAEPRVGGGPGTTTVVGPRVCLIAAPLVARSGVYRSLIETVREAREGGRDWHGLIGVSGRAAGEPLATGGGLREIGVEPRGIRGVGRLWRLLSRQPEVVSADVLISLVPQTDMALALGSKPWIAYVRGRPWPALGEAAWGKRVAWRLMERVALSRAREVWATTEVLAADIGVPCVTVAPGIRPVPRSWNGVGDRSRLVWAARYDEDKNPRLFCRVVGESNLEGVMYGSGPLRDEVSRSAPTNVEVRGWEDPRGLWSDALAYLGTSTREAFGRSAVEAAMSGVPVVLSDAFGCASMLYTDPELARRFVLPIDDRTRWTQAVTALATEDALRVRVSDHVHANALKLTIDASVEAIASRLSDPRCTP